MRDPVQKLNWVTDWILPCPQGINNITMALIGYIEQLHMGVSNQWPSSISELISRMEMRLRAPVTRGYFFLLGALRLVNAASPRNIYQKKISSGTQGNHTKAPFTHIRIFSNPQLFSSGFKKFSVHTLPIQIVFARPHVSGEFDSESGKK